MMTTSEPVATQSVPPEMSMQETRDWRVAAYVDHINSQWEESIMSIVEAGRLLLEAKEIMLRGDWSAMFTGTERLHFSRQTAFRLMKIAQHPILSNVTRVQHLPSSWGTLYELTKLPQPDLLLYLDQGLINPDTTRAQVMELFLPLRPVPPSDPSRRDCRRDLIDGEAGPVMGVWRGRVSEHQAEVLHQCECGHVHEDRRTKH